MKGQKVERTFVISFDGVNKPPMGSLTAMNRETDMVCSRLLEMELR